MQVAPMRQITGLNLAEKVDKHGGMWIRGIGVEAFVFYLIYYICAVGENLLFDTVELVADYEGFKFDSEFVGKYTALGRSSRLTSATRPSSYSQYTIRLLLSAIAFIDWCMGCISRWCGWRLVLSRALRSEHRCCRAGGFP